MIYHGRYRVVRRKPMDLRVNGYGVWTLFDGERVLGSFTPGYIRRMTGESPEEAARGGWRCYWQETPRREGK